MSVGFALPVHPDLDPVALVGLADAAMYDTRTERRSSTPTRTDGVVVDPRPGPDRIRDVLAVAAHEIKTPLTSIAGYASLLRANRQQLSSDAQDAAFDSLERQTDRLVRMVDQLLDLGRLGHPSAVSDDLVDLDAVITGALEVAPPPGPVSVIVLVASDASGPLVRADPTILERAVVNLLTNAYAHGGPHITVEATTSAGQVDLVVEDDGDGVPDDLVPTLFEPFARGPRHGAGTDGSGLGLAIAHDIARALGGSLAHEAVDPHGARLRLSLPLSG